MLSEGKMVFCDENYKAIAHFEKLGYQLPKGFNSSDFFMDCLSIDYRSPKLLKESTERVSKF